MTKISFDRAVPYIAGICLPLLVSASLTETICNHPTIEKSSFRTANRKMGALLNETPRLKLLQTVDSVPKTGLSAQDFLLRNYTDVAIATDLEPDDVLALALLFEEANRIYAESPNGKYPINLIIVGEGNTTIKRMRIDKMLQEYFNIPLEVTIKVIEGRATKDNIFSYDGEEFFDKKVLEQIPFPEEDNQAIEALSTWAAQATNPFVVQLKPAPELVYLDAELAAKTTIFFYGGFNIRKTATDSTILNDPQFAFAALPIFSAKLEGLISYLSNRFSKIAVLETFGVLGDQSSVCSEFEWTNKIGQMIANSNDKFIQMFRTVSSNWNAYLLDKFLDDCEQLSENLIQKPGNFTDFFVDIHEDFVQLQQACNQDRFRHLYQNIINHSAEISNHLSEDAGRSWKTLIRKIGLINKISASDVQFTLSDILVAMATTDTSNFFQATPIQISYDANGFLVPVADTKSNVIYYKTLDREKVASRLFQTFLMLF